MRNGVFRFVACSLLLASVAYGAGIDGGAAPAIFSFAEYSGQSVQNFQIPITLTEGKNGFSYAGDVSGDGKYLTIRDVESGALLPYEIEKWKSNGRSVVWVKVPTFSNATRLKVEWADPAEEVPPSENIWGDANFVYHFGDEFAKDSSARNASATVVDPTTAKAPTAEGGAFGDVDKRILVNSVSCDLANELTNKFTISFWMQANPGLDVNRESYVFSSRRGVAQFSIIFGYAAGLIQIYSPGDTSFADPIGRWKTNISVEDQYWHHYAYTYDGTVLKRYRDGECVGEQPMEFTFHAADRDLSYIIGGSNSGTLNFLHGALDEFRFENVARPPEWIQAMCLTSFDQHYHAVELPLFPYDRDTVLTNFPLLVTVSDALEGFDPSFNAPLDDLGRLCFYTDKSDAPLDFEVESVSAEPGTVSTFWLRVPEYSRDTKIFMTQLYSRTNTFVPSEIPINTNMWAGESIGIWHLQSAGQRWDSSGNNYHFQAFDANIWDHYPPAVNGPTGKFLAMKSSESYAAQTDRFRTNSQRSALTNVFTISFWAKKDPEDFANPRKSYLFQDFFNPYQFAILTGFSNMSPDLNSFYLWSSIKGKTNCDIPIPDTEWHFYAFSSDGTETKGYLDGELKAADTSKVFTFEVPGDATNHTLYLANSTSFKDPFLGKLDEFRFEQVARSADWIAACYQTQKVFQNDVPYGVAPLFSEKAHVDGTAMDALRFRAHSSYQGTAEVTFVYGSSDAGEDLSRWEHSIPLGTLTDGSVESTVTGISEDQPVYGRFYAMNSFGDEWSPLLFGRGGLKKAKYLIKISIAETLNSELENFPFCVKFQSGHALPADSSSLRIITKEGVSLPYEIERWNPQGESLVWISLPAHFQGKEIWATWSGRPEDSEGKIWPSTAVWGNDYERVYHLNEQGLDSSIRQAHVITNQIAALSDAILGKGYQFSGVTNEFTVTSQRPLRNVGEQFTLSWWGKYSDKHAQYLMSFVNQGRQISTIWNFNAHSVELYVNATDAKRDHRGTELTRINSRFPVDQAYDQWHLYAYTYDGTTLYGYLDGVQVLAKKIQVSLDSLFMGTGSYKLFIGCSVAGDYMEGLLDEIRFESVRRSAEWLRSSFENQRGGLYTLSETFTRGTCLLLQ